MCSGFKYDHRADGTVAVWAGMRCVGVFVVDDFGVLVRV